MVCLVRAVGPPRAGAEQPPKGPDATQPALVDDGSASSEDPPGSSSLPLLDQVRAQLPHEPLLITGELLVRRRRGRVVGRLGFDMELRWGARPPWARYTLRDSFGGTLAELTVHRPAGQAPVFAYRTGDPLQGAELPDLFAPIGTTDLCWHDLALSFLWWEGGAVVDEDKVKGRHCFVLKVPAPGDEGRGEYDHVLLWVDREVRMVLQMEAYATDGRLQKRLWVKSLKKVEGRWMIKDMEVEAFPREQRTRLLVREVSAGRQP